MDKNKNIIFANSTGSSENKAISIFRFSGENVLKEIFPLLLFPKKIKYEEIKPRYTYYVKIINPFYKKKIEFDIDNISDIKIIDSGIFVFYKAPASYTGEDMVELSVHGSKIVEYILTNIFTRIGFNYAKKGEFTKKAYLNGKIDLIQAEAINNLINSKTILSYQASINNIEKKFSNKISNIKNLLFNAISYLEASLDYPEEELDDYNTILEKTKSILTSSLKEINKLTKNSNYFKIINDGLKIAIIGPTNSGKSSFFNMLINEDRAIVSDIHGTTRDYLESFINIKNIPLKIYDTPGLRDSKDPIEQIGITKIDNILKETDIILFFITPDEKLTFENIDKIKTYKDKIIFIINKIDLLGNLKNIYSFLNISLNNIEYETKLEDYIKKFSFNNLTNYFKNLKKSLNNNLINKSYLSNIIYNLNFIKDNLIKNNFNTNHKYYSYTDNNDNKSNKLIIPLSVLFEKDFSVKIINDILSKIFNFDNIINEPPYIQSERELSFLNNLKNSIIKSIKLIENKEYFDIIAEELSYSLRNITELIGEDYNEELYNNIFDNFCLGK